jgi:hypothetical protein
VGGRGASAARGAGGRAGLAVTDEAHDLLDESLLVEEAPPLRVALRPQLPRRLARVPERGVVLLVLLPRVGGPLLGVLLPPTPTPSHEN